MTGPLVTVCPWCSARHDDAMIVDAAGWQPPKVGDVSLCISCAKPGIWTAYGLRLPTPAESTELMASPLLAQVVDQIHRVNGR